MKELQKPKKFQIILFIMTCFLSCLGLFGCYVAGTVVATTVAGGIAGTIATSGGREKIYVTEDKNSIKDCEFIKEVQANSFWGGLFFQERALKKTIADLTDQAFEAGANVLLIKSKYKSFNGSYSEGVAYRCQDADNTFAPAEEPQKYKSQEK